MFIVSLLLLIMGMSICYLLCLSFIGVTKKVKKIILPIILLSVIGYLSKAVLNIPSMIYILILLFSHVVLVKLFNREISWLISVIGSFLTFVTIEFVSLMLPFLNYKLGVTPFIERHTWGWAYLNLAEFAIPLTVLIILNASKISLLKYLQRIDTAN